MAGQGHSSETGLLKTPLNMVQYKRSSPRNFLVNKAQAIYMFKKKAANVIVAGAIGEEGFDLGALEIGNR